MAQVTAVSSHNNYNNNYTDDIVANNSINTAASTSATMRRRRSSTSPSPSESEASTTSLDVPTSSCTPPTETSEESASTSGSASTPESESATATATATGAALASSSASMLATTPAVAMPFDMERLLELAGISDDTLEAWQETEALVKSSEPSRDPPADQLATSSFASDGNNNVSLEATTSTSTSATMSSSSSLAFSSSSSLTFPVRQQALELIWNLLSAVRLPHNSWFAAASLFDRATAVLPIDEKRAPVLCFAVVHLLATSGCGVERGASKGSEHISMQALLRMWTANPGCVKFSAEDITSTQQKMLLALKWRVTTPTVQNWASAIVCRFDVLTISQFGDSTAWALRLTLHIARHLLLLNAFADWPHQRVASALLSMSFLAAGLFRADVLLQGNESWFEPPAGIAVGVAAREDPDRDDAANPRLDFQTTCRSATLWTSFGLACKASSLSELQQDTQALAVGLRQHLGNWEAMLAACPPPHPRPAPRQ